MQESRRVLEHVCHSVKVVHLKTRALQETGQLLNNPGTGTIPCHGLKGKPLMAQPAEHSRLGINSIAAYPCLQSGALQIAHPHYVAYSKMCANATVRVILHFMPECGSWVFAICCKDPMPLHWM